MQWLRCICVVALVLPGATGFQRLKRADAKDEPLITYEVIPPIATLYNVSANAARATNAASMSASEAYAADAEEKAQEALEISAEAKLSATKKQLESRLAFKRASHAADESISERVKAEDSARTSRQLLDKIPIIARQAAKDAVADVVAAAIEKMNEVANKTAEEAKKIEEEAFKKAGERAQEEALPFQQSKLRAEQSSVEFALRARELATAVIPLKGKAMEVANMAQGFQDANNPVMAQQMLMKGHDLLDKAIQMQDAAKGNAATASGIQNDLGYYDLAANAAAAWGAYQANPAGQRPEFPPLPDPLTLGPLKGKGKGKGKGKEKAKF